MRLPTTVLAQADSGVGVKNGVNAFGVKNFLGTFVPPFAVLNDRQFLESLGRRDTIAGMAEAVKVALIRDPEFLAWLEAHAAALATCDPDAVAELIRRAAGLHLEHIATSGDPFEMGSARPLDFGHWAAHRLESLTRNRLRHGEAVAIGIALDTLYSRAVGLLPAAAVERVLDLLGRIGLPRWDEALTSGIPPGGPSSWTGSPSSASTWAASSPSRSWPRSAGASRCTRCASRSWWAPSTSCAAATAGREARRSGRAAPHLLHQHSPGGDLGRGAREPGAPRPAGQGVRGAGPAVRRGSASVRGGGGGARPAGGAGRAPGFLRDSGLYVFTINGFPYGPFHGTRVKEEVYLPDWLDDARLSYSDRLAELLAALLPDEPGLEGTVSTVPGANKAASRGAADESRMAELMVRHAAGLHRLWERTGKVVSLALEPEPCCHMETVDETVASSRAPGRGAGLGRVRPARRPPAVASARPPCGATWGCASTPATWRSSSRTRRLGSRRSRSGHPRRQGAAERGPAGRSWTRATAALVDALRPFAEAVYLHQVVERRAGRLRRYLDLPDALEAAARDAGGAPRVADPLPRAPVPRRARSVRDHPALPARGPRPPPAASEHAAPRGGDLHVGRLPEADRREDIADAGRARARWVLDQLGVRL